MDIDTIRFPYILEANILEQMEYFLSHTAFIVSHKSESIETLLRVWEVFWSFMTEKGLQPAQATPIHR